MAGGVPRRGGESLLSHGFAVPALPEGEPRTLRTVLAPRIYEGGGPRSGRGSSPAAAGKALSVTLRVPALPEGEPRGLRPVLAPRIYEGGGPRSGRGSFPAAAGTASSVTASPCQLSQRESRGRCAPFLPPAAAGRTSSVTAAPCQLPRRGSRGGLRPDHRGFPGKANRFSCRGASKSATSQELNIYPLFFFIIAWYHKDKPIQFLHFFIFLSSFLLQNTRCIGSGYFVVGGLSPPNPRLYRGNKHFSICKNNLR